MATITYTRPTGTELTVNDTRETRELAEARGWVVSKPIAKRKVHKAPVPRTTKPKTKKDK